MAALHLSPRIFQYACAVSGILCAVSSGLGFVIAGFVPPMRPNWTAEETVSFYHDHHKRIQIGATFIILSGMFYLPLTTGISAQMQRIPNLHCSVPMLQMASGAAGIFSFMMPGVILAAANFRLDRPIEITQALNELFWLTLLMPWPAFLTQGLSFTYAIMSDQRPKPLFPKATAILNIAVPVMFIPSLASHCFTTGPLAWNGAVSFWLPAVAFFLQVVIDSLCLARAISIETLEDEKLSS